jgi:hypothetical protein
MELGLRLEPVSNVSDSLDIPWTTGVVFDFRG